MLGFVIAAGLVGFIVLLLFLTVYTVEERSGFGFLLVILMSTVLLGFVINGMFGGELPRFEDSLSCKTENIVIGE